MELSEEQNGRYQKDAVFGGVNVQGNRQPPVEWIRDAADQGNADAQLCLGCWYKYGLGVRQDYAAAVELFKKAAGQGLAAAQCELGKCYKNGLGVAQNHDVAINLFRQSAV